MGLTVLLAMPCVETLLPPQSPLHASAALSGAASRRRASVEDACTGRRLVSSMAAVLVAGGGAAPQERPAGFWDRVWGARHHLLAGAMGRFVAVNIMFPVDTVKTRLQMQMNGGAAMTNQVWQNMIRPPLFKGVHSSLLGQVPNGMLVYGSYEIYKRELHERFPDMSSNQVRFVAAMMGDVTGAFWLAPFERTKQSVQAGLFTGMRESLRYVVSDRGLLGLYSGFKAQVVRDLAFHAIQLPLYEGLKDRWLAKVHADEAERARALPGHRPSDAPAPARSDLRPVESMLCGAAAGAISGGLTTPLDVLKTRLMTCTVDCAGGSVRTTLLNVFYTEGLLGLTAGMPQRALYIACGSAIFWTVFEQTVRIFKAMDPQVPARTAPAAK